MSIFDLTYGTAEGFACLVTDDFTAQRWFEWPREADFMERYVALRADEDVYFTTTLYNDRERRSDAASWGMAVYADADLCHPDNFRLKPTAYAETSPGKYHAYWTLDRPTTAAELSELSQLIATAHKDQGCDAGWIQTKLLRVPGTSNTKYAETYEVQVHYSGETYTADEIRTAYHDITPIDKSHYVDASMPKVLPELWDVTEKIPESLWGLYADIPGESQSWSERLWKFECDLFREGLSREEVFVLAKNAKCNKYARDNRPDSALWAEVLRASVRFSDDVIVELPPEDPVKKEMLVSFLSPEERQWVADHPGFVEDYVAWVKTRSPEAAEVYQRTLAYILLSCVYGAWGYIIPQFGAMKLNLWALILGDTTRTKKSTSVDLMLKILRKWEERIEQKIDIGNDFTSEGLNAALADRDGMVSLAHRDEVQGFIHEMETKSYMAGTKQTMTGLYQGNVEVKLRATKGAGQSKRSEVIFDFVGIGIQKEMASLMTEKDFRSGFLPRFLWAVAPTPPWTPESEYVGQQNEEQIYNAKGEDRDVEAILQTFQRNRVLFASGEPKKILLDEDAHKRLMKWKIDSARMLQGVDNEGIINPSRERLSFSIWKCAALLAMHDGRTTANVGDVLTVLAQAERWFEDMVLMANAVANSEFQAIADSVEEFIIGGTNHTKPKAAIYRKFGRKNQVDEYLDNLHAQGRIKRNPDGTVTALVLD